MRPSVLYAFSVTRAPSLSAGGSFAKSARASSPGAGPRTAFRSSGRSRGRARGRGGPSLRSRGRLPRRLPARTRTRAGRDTFSARSGTERQPSSSFCSPSLSRTTGLTRTISGARIRADREVDDRDALVQADLGSRQPDPGRGMAGLDHVGDQARDLLGSRIDVGVLRGQPRIAVPHDVADQAGGPAGSAGRRRRRACPPGRRTCLPRVTGRPALASAARFHKCSI